MLDQIPFRPPTLRYGATRDDTQVFQGAGGARSSFRPQQKHMTQNTKILVGKIVAAQGLRGEVRVQTYTQNPTDFKDFDVGAALYAARSGLHEMQPLQIKFIRVVPNTNVIIASVDGINDRTAAEALRNTELYIDRGALPALAPDEFYHADLIDMNVIGRGKVIAVHNFGAGDILETDTGEMISFDGATVDMDKREIQI